MAADKNVKVVADLSDTQRLVLLEVIVNGDDRVELRKEWRRGKSDDWTASKGITIPRQFVPVLASALTSLCKK